MLSDGGGTVRRFIELGTLHETVNLLPEFDEQLGVAVSERREMFHGWLLFIRVVALAPSLHSWALEQLPCRGSKATTTPAPRTWRRSPHASGSCRTESTFVRSA